MDIKRLDIGIETISNIFHISDIHIRTLKRHREYLEVFENMMLEISQHADANAARHDAKLNVNDASTVDESNEHGAALEHKPILAAVELQPPAG